MISFTVIGRPQPAGSKKAFKHPMTGQIVVADDAKHSRPWKQQVAGAALHELELKRAVKLTGPVAMSLTFFLRRPKSHWGTGKNSGRLKPTAPAYPTTRPDALKLARAVEDALTDAGLWRDDAQVVHQVADKAYGDPERVEISVWALPDSVASPAVREAAA